MSTQELSEEDTKYRYITPAIKKSGWVKYDILMEYFFYDGKIIFHGKKVTRGKRKRGDYLLFKDNIPLAIVEAKKISNARRIVAMLSCRKFFSR